MNLTNFLKQIDAFTEQYSTEQLTAFIHDIGRVFPKHRREDFLEMLKSIGNKARKTSNKNEEKRIQCLELGNQYLKKRLTDVGISYSEEKIDDDCKLTFTQ